MTSASGFFYLIPTSENELLMGHINYQLSTWDISIINPKMTQVIHMSHGPMPRKDDRSAEEDTLKAAKWWPVMTVTEPWAMENGP